MTILSQVLLGFAAIALLIFSVRLIFTLLLRLQLLPVLIWLCVGRVYPPEMVRPSTAARCSSSKISRSANRAFCVSCNHSTSGRSQQDSASRPNRDSTP